MFTSSAEYRLLLRQDNAAERMLPRAREAGTLRADEEARLEALGVERRSAAERIRSVRVACARHVGRIAGGQAAVDGAVAVCGTTAAGGTGATDGTVATDGAGVTEVVDISEVEVMQDVVTLADGLLEARISIPEVVGRPELADLPAEAIESAAIEIRYAGYIDRQRREVERAFRAERFEIPESLYSDPLREISCEGREKLLRVRPRSIGHASRIPGFSPADVAVLVVYAERERRRAASTAS